jgi:hypothetical protein
MFSQTTAFDFVVGMSFGNNRDQRHHRLGKVTPGPALSESFPEIKKWKKLQKRRKREEHIFPCFFALSLLLAKVKRFSGRADASVLKV